MRSPEYYLVELLFDHDCVTLPGFGGFIIQSHPARIDQARHRIHPPARNVSFNRLLSHDDGILAEHMAQAGKVTVEEALDIIYDYSKQLLKKIVNGETLIIKGLGEFSKSAEDEITFNAETNVNFNRSSYGLGPVSLYPIEPNAEKRPAKKRTDRTARDFREKKPASVRRTLAVSIPLIIFLLYGIIFPVSMQKMYTNYSAIVVDWLKPSESQTIVNEPVKAPVALQQPERAGEVSQPASTPSSEIIEKEKVETPVITPSYRYYVIGGCFEKEENAEKFLKLLKNNGFDAEKAGMTKTGQTRISYRSFTEKQPALTYLKKIKEEENPAAWLLKY